MAAPAGVYFFPRRVPTRAPAHTPILAGSVHGAPAIATPQAAPPPSVESAASGGGGCHTWAELRFNQWKTNPALNVRHFCQSDTPRNGYYWAILYLDAVDTDSNGQALAFYLLSPTFQIPAALATDSSWQIESLLAGAVMIGPGQSQTANLSATSSQQSAVSPTGYQIIIVPSGWRVAVAEQNGVVSSIQHYLNLRAAYLELANNEQIPSL